MIQRLTIRPPALADGATIGVFTPSFPANVRFRGQYLRGLEQLRELGFRVVEGVVTRACADQGYRSASPEERAAELMGLLLSPEIDGVIACIGGHNTSSLLPFLDYAAIREHPKVICGYSDVTSLHLALLARAGLSSFHGPAVMPSFGDWPAMPAYTRDSFLQAVRWHRVGERRLAASPWWSEHVRDARTDQWRTETRRQHPSGGWRALVPGEAHGRVIVANLDTLLAAAGTDYFPAMEGRLLVLEEQALGLAHFERSLRHLSALGVFEKIAGLVLGRPEVYETGGAPFDLEALLFEVIGPAPAFPIVLDCDVGHTHPMLTLAQDVFMSIVADSETDVSLVVREPMVV